MDDVTLMAKGVWWDVASCPFPDEEFSLSLAQPCIESVVNKYTCPGPVTIYAMVNAKNISRSKLEELANSGIIIMHDEFVVDDSLHRLLKCWTSDIPPPAYMLVLSDMPSSLMVEKDFSRYGYCVIHARTHRQNEQDWQWHWKYLLETEMHDDYLNVDYPNLNFGGKSFYEPPWYCLVCEFSADKPEDFFNHLYSSDHTHNKERFEQILNNDDGFDIFNPPPFHKYFKAPSSLLRHSHSGFLITCPRSRETLASREIIPILEKYLGSIDEEKYEVLKSCGMSMPRKQLYVDEIIEENEWDSVLDDIEALFPETGENATVQEIIDDFKALQETEKNERETVLDDIEALQETGENATVQESIDDEHNTLMSLIKLTSTGLRLFTLPVGSSVDPTDIVSRIIDSMESGGMKKAPKWCQRIFPVQATCGLTENELRETVSRLVQRFVDDKNISPSEPAKPAKFAVRYNQNGVEERKGKIRKEAVDQCPLLGRSKCFDTVAAGVKDIVPDAVVDLKSPELCVLLELLPLSGIPKGSFVAAVSVLPPRLVTKRNLSIKPLVAKKDKTN